MALKQYNPTSPGRRHLVLVDQSELHKGKPGKSLVEGLTKTGGRGGGGRIAVRFRGGGAKRLYRMVDFKRRKFDVAGTVERLEYDPNRTAFIALIKYADGELAYILAPQRLKVGDEVIAGEKVDVKPGNAMPLRGMPIGTIIHNVELKPVQGRPDRPLGRDLRPAGRPRRRLRPDPPELGRAAHGAGQLHGHGRRGLEPRPHERGHSARPAASRSRAAARTSAASP